MLFAFGKVITNSEATFPNKLHHIDIPVKTYGHQFFVATGYRQEDLPIVKMKMMITYTFRNLFTFFLIS